MAKNTLNGKVNWTALVCQQRRQCVRGNSVTQINVSLMMRGILSTEKLSIKLLIRWNCVIYR